MFNKTTLNLWILPIDLLIRFIKNKTGQFQLAAFY
jgi:hypothetical protein